MATDDRSVDQLFDTLGHRHRRRVLAVLRDRTDCGDEQLSLDALVEAAAADDESRVRIAMVHCHLPKLADGGYVDWDPTAERVARGPEWNAVASLLDRLGEFDPDAASEPA